MGWEKVACWSTKSTKYLKRVKIKEKLLWRAYRNSPTFFRTVPSPTMYGLLFPKIGGFQPHLQLQSLLFQEWVKLRLCFMYCTIVILCLECFHCYVIIIDCLLTSFAMLYFSTDGCINKSLTYLLTYLLSFEEVQLWP